jgi:hypothetical protein
VEEWGPESAFLIKQPLKGPVLHLLDADIIAADSMKKGPETLGGLKMAVIRAPVV